MDAKDDRKIVDVSNGEPQTIKVDKGTTLVLKGKNVSERTFTDLNGHYVVSQILKNTYITNGRGGYEKIGKQYVLVAEKI